jgi:alcohol dehydrogenase (cytochrome c)
LYAHVDGRDPITGKVAFSIHYDVPPHASLLTTGGNLLFVPGADGVLRAYDASNGKLLWSHQNGMGHNGGIITYTAKGKQYIAVETGWGSLVGDGYGEWFGEPYASYPKDAGVLKVFALP